MNNLLDVEDRSPILIQNGDVADKKLDQQRSKAFVVNRPVYTQREFDADHGANDCFREPLRQRIKSRFAVWRKKHISGTACLSLVRRSFPVIGIMQKYKWRQWLLADFIAGLIVGIMHIPQSMAYAFLAELKPMYGLYVSFFPSIFYFIFGTSRHISIGTIAIVSLLTGKFVENSIKLQSLNLNETSNFVFDTDSSNDTEQQIELAYEFVKATRVTGLTLCVGLTQVIMGALRLGYLTRYLSDPMISGFTVGAAVHVMTSQIKYCFGIKIDKYTGLFNIIMTYKSIFENIKSTNLVTLALTLVCITILFINKQFINPRVVRKIKIPIPMELLIVISATVVSKYLQLNEKHKVKIVGHISQGLPSPALPNTTNLSNFVSDIIITAVVAFSICISLGKIFAKKHGYNIDPNQEFLAYGVMNIFSSFFLCYPAAASVSRSAVQESVGGKTQLVSVVSSVLLLFILLFIGPVFRTLPNCVLSSIIIVALKGIFMQFGELKELWIFSLWDFTTWIFTFLATAFLDVEYGLIIGISISILTTMLRTQSPNSHILGQVEGTDLYKNIDIYDKCNEIRGIKIFRYEGSLYFASSEHFKKALYAKVGVDPRKVKHAKAKMEKKLRKIHNLSDFNDLSMEKKDLLENQLYGTNHPSIHHVIIDCSTWGYIDYVGVKTLYQVIEDYKSINVTVLLANPKTDIRQMFVRSNFYHLIDDQIIYVSVHDAVVRSLYDYRLKENNS